MLKKFAELVVRSRLFWAMVATAATAAGMKLGLTPSQADMVHTTVQTVGPTIGEKAADALEGKPAEDTK